MTTSQDPRAPTKRPVTKARYQGFLQADQFPCGAHLPAIFGWRKYMNTLPETNIAPEKRAGPQKETHFPTPVFQVLC